MRGAGLVIWGVAAGGLACLLIGFLLLHLSTGLRAEAADWPSVPARIVESEIGTGTELQNGVLRTVYNARIAYAYEVAGASYTSRQVAFGGLGMSDVRADAERWLNRYPRGAAATAYHDPRDPRQAVLDRESAGGDALGYVVIGLGVFLALLAGGLAIAVQRYERRWRVSVIRIGARSR